MTTLPASITIAAFVAYYAAAKAEALAPVEGCARCAKIGHRAACSEHRTDLPTLNADDADTRVFLCTEERAEAIRKVFAKLQKRASLLEVEGPAMVEAPVAAIPVGTAQGIEHIARVPICVTGEHPHLNGWHFVAAIDHTNGTLVKGTDGDVTVNVVHRSPHATARHLDARWWTAPSYCDHCATRRRRSRTYLLTDRHRTVQVGSTCIADFLGGQSAEHLAMLAELEAALADASNEDADGSFGGGRAGGRVHVGDLLTHVAYVIAEHGWVSRAQERIDEYGAGRRVATSTLATMRLYPGLGQPRPSWDVITYDEAAKRAAEVIAWVRSLFDGTAESLASLDDYQRNLVAAVLSGCCNARDTGLVASAFAAKARVDGADIARKFAKSAAVSEHFGTVGKRAEYALTVERVFDCEGAYGTLHIHTMRDDAGCVAVWKTTSARFDVGDRLTGRATVKAHGEYRGTKQTELTRCDLARVAAEHVAA